MPTLCEQALAPACVFEMFLPEPKLFVQANLLARQAGFIAVGFCCSAFGISEGQLSLTALFPSSFPVTIDLQMLALTKSFQHIAEVISVLIPPGSHPCRTDL